MTAVRAAAARVNTPGRDAVTVLCAAAVLLVLLPSYWVVPGVGGAGRPAVLLGLGALVWWGYAMATPQVQSPEPSPPLRVGAGTFVVALLASYGAAAGVLQTGVEQRAMDRAVLVTVGMVGLMLLAAEGIGRLDRLGRLINVMLACAFVMAVIGIIQFRFGVDPTEWLQIPGLQSTAERSFMGERAGYTRVSGTAIHPIEFAVVLTTLLPMLLYRAFWASSRFWQAVAWTSVVVVAGAVLLTISRTAVLGLVAGGLVLAAGWSMARRVGVAVLAGGFIVVMQALVPGLIGTIYGLFTNWENDPSVAARTRELSEIDVALRDSPWLGRGPRTFVPELHGYVDNQYVLTLIEQGLIGVSALLALLGAAAWLAFRGMRAAPTPQLADLNRALLASVTVVAISFATYDGLSFPMATGVAFCVFGLTAAASRLTVAEGRTS